MRTVATASAAISTVPTMTSRPPVHSIRVTRGLAVTGSIGGGEPTGLGTTVTADGRAGGEVEGAVGVAGRGDTTGYPGRWRLCGVDGRGP